AALRFPAARRLRAATVEPVAARWPAAAVEPQLRCLLSAELAGSCPASLLRFELARLAARGPRLRRRMAAGAPAGLRSWCRGSGWHRLLRLRSLPLAAQRLYAALEP